MIVCLCHGVRDRDIDAAIADGAETVEHIGEQCGAGTGCGACIADIEGKLERAGCGRSRAGDCPRELELVTLRTPRLETESGRDALI